MLKPDFADMRAHLKSTQAIVLVGGRAFVAYPYREAEPVPEGVAVMHIADNPEAFGREHAPRNMACWRHQPTLCAVAGRLGELVDKNKVAAGLATWGARRRAARESTRGAVLARAPAFRSSADAGFGGARGAA